MCAAWRQQEDFALKISIENITKTYGSTQALQDFTLEIKSGCVFGLVGPNGAGKSTLMKILATLERPTAGTVLLDDVDIIKKPNDMRNILGYLPQDVAVYPNLTAQEFLSYIAAMKGLDAKSSRRQITELLDVLHLTAAKKRRLSTYSGGMRQRVGIACALLGDPQVIIVDEPSVGLDPEERIALRDLFGELAKTRVVLLSTHIISDVESTASRLAVIQNGRLKFQGTPQQFCEHSAGDMEAAYLKIIRGETALNEAETAV
jgi:ABC-type multidrug transport system ATPase subunit